MRTGRVRPVFGLLLMLGLLLGGFIGPVSAEDGPLPGATPVSSDIVEDSGPVDSAEPEEPDGDGGSPDGLADDADPAPGGEGKVAPASVGIMAENDAIVTFNVSVEGGGPVPADLEICVYPFIGNSQCSEPGTAPVTFAIPMAFSSTWLDYTVEASGHVRVADGETIRQGRSLVIDVTLIPVPPANINITRVVSDGNPAPGDEISITTHIWGVSGTGSVHLTDGAPDGLTNVTVTCTATAGSLGWTDCQEDYDLLQWLPLDITPEADGTFDITVVFTGTVPSTPGWSEVSRACVLEPGAFMVQAASGPIAGDHCASISIVAQSGAVADASVTFNLSTDDERPVPAGSTICLGLPGEAMTTCADASAGTTFPLAAGAFAYSVFAPGYMPATGSVTVAAGESASVGVELQAGSGLDLTMTMTVSDPAPVPGDQISYEIRLSSVGDTSVPIRFANFLPAELSEVRVACDLIQGWSSSSCAAPLDGQIVGMIVPDIDWDTDLYSIEAVITITGTVPEEVGIALTNVACVYDSDELSDGLCDAVTATTTLPDPTVTINVTADDGDVPADTEICIFSYVTTSSTCSEPGAESFTVTILPGDFHYNVEAFGYRSVWGARQTANAGDALVFDAVLEGMPRAEVTFTVATDDGGDIPATAELCVSSNESGNSTCAEPGATTWTVTIPAGYFSYWVDEAEPYLDVYEWEEIEAGASVEIAILLETPRLVEVTFVLVPEDGGEVPEDAFICVVDDHDAWRCSEDGEASWTVTLLANAFDYWTGGTEPYFGVDVNDATLPGTDPVTIEIPLRRESGPEIVKSVSDATPLAGSTVTYTLRITGVAEPHTLIWFEDELPGELTDVTAACELVSGELAWGEMPCLEPIEDDTVYGGFMPADNGDYEAVISISGTVPAEPGIEVENVACAGVFSELGRAPARAGILAFQRDPSETCDAVTFVTRAPLPGSWGAAAMTVDVETAYPGDTVTYTLTLPWQGGEPGANLSVLALNDARIGTLVPGALADVTWTCEAENATCAPASGSGNDVAVDGTVVDPTADALLTLTISGTVAAGAPEGEVIASACVEHDLPPVQAFRQPACAQAPQALFTVLAQPLDPTPTPTAPVEPTPTPTAPAEPTPTPTMPVDPTATVTPTPDSATPTAPPDSATPGPTAAPSPTPEVTVLPSTGGAPGGDGAALGWLAGAAAAALLALGVLTLRSARVRR